MIDLYWMTNLHNVDFKMCGLDIERNFLCAPDCECGCGGKGNVVLPTKDDVLNFCGSFADVNDCDFCAVFAIDMKNNIIGAICYDGETRIVEFKKGCDYEEIGCIASRFGLHCYGLIIEIDDGLWKIVEK